MLVRGRIIFLIFIFLIVFLGGFFYFFKTRLFFLSPVPIAEPVLPTTTLSLNTSSDIEEDATPSSAEDPLLMIEGTVQSISRDTLTLQYEDFNRKVLINNQTVLQRQSLKTKDDLILELNDYYRTSVNAGPTASSISNMSQPSSVFSLVPLNLNELRVGDMIRVETDNDISKQDSFTASRVFLLNR